MGTATWCVYKAMMGGKTRTVSVIKKRAIKFYKKYQTAATSRQQLLMEKGYTTPRALLRSVKSLQRRGYRVTVTPHSKRKDATIRILNA